MNMKQCLKEYNEQNWQVVEPEKTTVTNDKIENGKANAQEIAGFGDEYKTILEARVRSLRQVVSILKSELLEEKEMWKKEVGLMASLLSTSNSESDVNSELETEPKSPSTLPIAPHDHQIISAPLIKDFEEKLTRYQGALAQAQAEKRYNIRRQIAANTYRKRLYEVEKLCQEELNKVRETATYLEPLKQMVSEWTKPRLHHGEPPKAPGGLYPPENLRSGIECGGDFIPARLRDSLELQEDRAPQYEVPVKQIDASLVMDEDASSEIKGKIVLQIGSLPTEVPTICYSAKFE